MGNALKAELKKILTVRSTYFVTGLVLLITLFLSIFAFGYQSGGGYQQQDYMVTTLYSIIATFSTFAAILSILLVAHEYRYNTILYALTLTRQRLLIVFAKILTVMIYVTVVGSIVGLVGYFGILLGMSLKGVDLVSQTAPLLLFIAQTALYLWAVVIFAVLIALIIRSLVGAIVFYFLLPAIEALVSPLLKNGAAYLPNSVIGAINSPGQPIELIGGGKMLENGPAIAVFGIYICILGIVACMLFMKRDAN